MLTWPPQTLGQPGRVGEAFAPYASSPPHCLLPSHAHPMHRTACPGPPADAPCDVDAICTRVCVISMPGSRVMPRKPLARTPADPPRSTSGLLPSSHAGSHARDRVPEVRPGHGYRPGAIGSQGVQPFGSYELRRGHSRGEDFARERGIFTREERILLARGGCWHAPLALTLSDAPGERLSAQRANSM